MRAHLIALVTFLLRGRILTSNFWSGAGIELRLDDDDGAERALRVVEKLTRTYYDSDNWIEWFVQNTKAAVKALIEAGQATARESEIHSASSSPARPNLDDTFSDSDDSDIEVSMSCCFPCSGSQKIPQKNRTARESPEPRSVDNNEAQRERTRGQERLDRSIKPVDVTNLRTRHGNNPQVAKQLFDKTSAHKDSAQTVEPVSDFDSPLIKQGSQADIELHRRIDAGVTNLMKLLGSAKGKKILESEAKHFGGEIRKAQAIMVFQVRQQIKAKVAKQVRFESYTNVVISSWIEMFDFLAGAAIWRS